MVRDHADGEVGVAGTLLAGENRADFANACCSIFDARDFSTIFSQRPEERLAYEAQRLVAEAAKILRPANYLTLMFELAYSNRAIHANEEGTRWSDMMQAAAPMQQNAHWARFLERDREGRRYAEMAGKLMSGGIDPKELSKIKQQMAGEAQKAERARRCDERAATHKASKAGAAEATGAAAAARDEPKASPALARATAVNAAVESRDASP